MAITNFQVGTSVTAAYTASADTAVTVIYITNKTDGDGTVDVYVTPNGVSASANHLVYSQLTIKARDCLLYTSPSPRDGLLSRMPSSA